MLLAIAFLAGCDENGDFVAMQAFDRKPTDVQGETAPRPATVTSERDIEAPEVFSAAEAGLWDGRPSLGGVWVAHPDVNEPERVIIRNTENGKFVVGALFRREREIPGPRLQISSDAAEALGMLAGAPAELNVTALRKEEIAAPQDAATVAAPAEVADTALNPVEIATAALDASATGDAPTGIAPEATAAPIPAALPVQTTSSALAKPFVQIGIFSVEANAERTAKQMQTAGLTPTLKRFDRDGKPFWRVLVGPAATAGEQRKLLTQVKGEGFTDAYAVTN